MITTSFKSINVTQAWAPTDTQVRTSRVIPKAFIPEGGAGIGNLVPTGVTVAEVAPTGAQSEDWTFMLEDLSHSWVV